MGAATITSSAATARTPLHLVSSLTQAPMSFAVVLAATGSGGSPASRSSSISPWVRPA